MHTRNLIAAAAALILTAVMTPAFARTQTIAEVIASGAAKARTIHLVLHYQQADGRFRKWVGTYAQLKRGARGSDKFSEYMLGYLDDREVSALAGTPDAALASRFRTAGLQWMCKAARAGEWRAATSLASRYRRGVDGVPVNWIMAYAFDDIALSQGFRDQKYLREDAAHLNGNQLAYAQALATSWHIDEPRPVDACPPAHMSAAPRAPRDMSQTVTLSYVTDGGASAHWHGRISTLWAHARTGDTFAEFLLGEWYERRAINEEYRDSSKETRDWQRAHQWLGESARAGNWHALDQLADSYGLGSGLGEPPDAVLSYTLYDIAMVRGEPTVSNRILLSDVRYERKALTPHELEFAQALAINWVPGTPVSVLAHTILRQTER